MVNATILGLNPIWLAEPGSLFTLRDDYIPCETTTASFQNDDRLVLFQA